MLGQYLLMESFLYSELGYEDFFSSTKYGLNEEIAFFFFLFALWGQM